MSELSCEPQGYKKPVMSIGDEFVVWAEQYWRIDELFDNTVKDPAEKGDEKCPYSAVKPIFIKKINDLIEERVRHYM
jgi:hypothetical protein